MDLCQSCGACCAHFRVSFYWAEAQVSGWPAESIVPITSVMACLAGTDHLQPRCHALVGDIGVDVACGRYAQRLSPCREVQPGDDKCNRARAAHGLDQIPPQ